MSDDRDELSLMVISVLYRANPNRVADLIANNANINQIYAGRTILEHAVKRDNAEIVHLLISAGAIYEKMSLLEYAVKESSSAVIEVILSFWGDINAVYLDEYPLIYAINTGNPKLAKVLKAHGASLDKVFKQYSINLKDLKIAESCMEAGGDPNGKYKDSYILTHAILNGDDKLAKLLKKYGASLELAQKHDKFVIDWDNFKVVQAFIEAGGDINKPYDGLYPLTHAIVNGEYKVVKVLKNYNANIDPVLQNDYMALKIALSFNDSDVNKAFAESLLTLDYPYEEIGKKKLVLNFDQIDGAHPLSDSFVIVAGLVSASVILGSMLMMLGYYSEEEYYILS